MDGFFSQNILGQIGSVGNLDGENAIRASLTVAQLLDLLAWFKIFGATGSIIKQYPHIWRATMKAYFHSRPDVTEGRVVDLESQVGVEWAKAKIAHFHNICEQEFLARVCTQSDEFFNNIYTSKHTQYLCKTGEMVSSLCGDVFTFISVQLRTIQDHCSPQNRDLVTEAAYIIFVHLRSKQTQYRDTFLHTFESALSAANDFVRLYDQCEESMNEIKLGLKLQHEKNLEISHHSGEQQNESINSTSDSSQRASNDSSSNIEEVFDYGISEILALFIRDAVYAAESIHGFIFEPIFETISPMLFTHEWEEMSTHNQEASSIVRTIEDFWEDIVQYLDKLLLPKAMDAIVTATVSFYVYSLLIRANEHKSNVIPYWSNEERTMDRMEKDIEILQTFFQDKYETIFCKSSVEKDSRVLVKTNGDKFKILHVIHELIRIAFGTGRPKSKTLNSSFGKRGNEKTSLYEEASHLILFLHQKIRNEEITQRIVGDIWHLAAPRKEWKIWSHMKKDITWRALTPISTNDEPLLQQKSLRSKLNLKLKTKLTTKNNTLLQCTNTPQDINSRQKPGVLLDLKHMLEELYNDKKKQRKIPKNNNAVTKIQRAMTPKEKISRQ